MKHIRIYSITVVFSFALFSCGNTTQKAQNDGGINIEAVVNSKSGDPNAKGDNKCLLDYQDSYDALLSEADILRVTGFSKDVLETKYNNRLKNQENHEFVYKFKNGRKGKVPGFDTEMQVPDMVSVRSIKPMSVTTFNQSYQAVTDEQMQMANEALKDVAEGNSGGADAEMALKKAKAQGVDQDQIKKTGGTLTSAFKEVSKGYRPVEGLGDAACWNVVTNELYVLQNGVKFEIRTDISNNKEKNRSAAVELAKIILHKCN